MTVTSAANKNTTEASSLSTLCIACSRYERSIVFIPCGHLLACVACAHSLTNCPRCQSKITATLRIYE